MTEEKIGVLWEKSSDRAGMFMSGIIGGKRIIAFRNLKKRRAEEPDWNVFPQRTKDTLPEREPGEDG